MWFENLTGFAEENPDQVRANLTVEGSRLISLVNGAQYNCGKLEVPTLAELKAQAPSLESYNGQIHFSEVVGNVQHFHQDSTNQGALFQAASQFNLLEMVGPEVSPEEGIEIYEYDRTQGPACAIACGAGTIYRNYFVEVNGEIGQTFNNQIDCLDEIGKALGNEGNQLWQMKNGYALANAEGLQKIAHHLDNLSVEDYETIKDKLKIGLQWDSEATLSASKHRVSQAYCSALPVAYSHLDSNLWKSFAKLILLATYEATFYTGLINYEKTGNKNVFLTLVGGGAFGNDNDWIFEAIREAAIKFQHTPLEMKIVSYGSSNSAVKYFTDSLG